jgi:hypothetical protein
MRVDSAWYLNVANNEKNGSVFDRAVPGIALDKDDPAIRRNRTRGPGRLSPGPAHRRQRIVGGRRAAPH